jgi:hypothetical protein
MLYREYNRGNTAASTNERRLSWLIDEMAATDDPEVIADFEIAIEAERDNFDKAAVQMLDTANDLTASVEAIEAAEKAGWLERAAQYRLREALSRGDAAATKLFASTLLDIWKVIEKVEPLADRRVGQLRTRLEERADIQSDFKRYLALYGPAYIRAHQPSPTECQEGAIHPMTEEEVEAQEVYVVRLLQLAAVDC